MHNTYHSMWHGVSAQQMSSSGDSGSKVLSDLDENLELQNLG